MNALLGRGLILHHASIAAQRPASAHLLFSRRWRLRGPLYGKGVGIAQTGTVPTVLNIAGRTLFDWQMGNRQTRLIDGTEYRINQKMVRVEKKGWLEWFFYKGLSKYIGVPFLTIIAPILYVLASSFDWAKEILGAITWIFTPWVDKALVDVKQELLKDVKGKRVLNVNSGSGDWLNYLKDASMVTELEPNSHRFNFLGKEVDKFKKEYPYVNVELIDRPIEEFYPGQPYDIVILGNVLCQAPDTKAFLQQVDRMLVPGGKVVFQEHIRQPPGTLAGIAQDIFAWWWKAAKGGCGINKNPVDLLRQVEKWQVEAWDLRVDGAVIFDRIAVGMAVKSKIP